MILDNEYKKSQDWSKAKMVQLADRLGLSESQVYKWRWDRIQSDSLHYYRFCESVAKSRKPRRKLFAVVRGARDRQTDNIFAVKK
jgi:hypothetical protein